MHDVYKTIKEYNPDRKCNILIIFDEFIADIIKKNLIVLIILCYFAVAKGIRLNCTHVFIMKIPNKREL